MTTLFRTIEASAPEADRVGRPQPQVIAALRQSGMMGLNVPESYGGLGCDALECNRQIAWMAKHDASMAIMTIQHLSVIARILECGTEEQKKRFLPPMARGEILGASAWSEKGAGAAKQNLATTASLQPDGTWQVGGTKTFTTNAGMADVYLVLVKTGDQVASTALYGAGGQSFFLIESGCPGVVARTDLELTGMRSSSTGFLDLCDCRVAATNVLGPVGGAAQVIAGVRQSGLSLGAVSLGIAEAALDLARQAVRKQPADSRQRLVNSVRLARMAVQVSAARALVEQAGRRLYTVATDVLASKVFASEVSEQVCRETQQLLGGGGFIRGTTIDRLVRDARAIALMGPVNDLALDLVSEEVLT